MHGKGIDWIVITCRSEGLVSKVAQGLSRLYVVLCLLDRYPLLLPPCVLLTQSTASTYFHLPVDEQEDKDINAYQRKYLTWTAEPSPSSPSPSSSSSSSNPAPPPPFPAAERTTALQEVLAHEDLYQILGVTKSDNLDKLTLRRAYLTRSRACHPESVRPTRRLDMYTDLPHAANSQTTPRRRTPSRRSPSRTRS